MPNSNAKKRALNLHNAGNYQGLVDLIQSEPSLAKLMNVLEGNDFSGNMANVPAHMRPNPNNMSKVGGRRSLRKKRTLRKKRSARKTRRHQ
jgi:hypothetical protein